MRFRNTETPSFSNNAGTAITGPAIVETMELIDHGGNALATFTKDSAGVFRHSLVQSAVLQADFPKVNDTLTAVPDLTLNLTAGHWYRVTLQGQTISSVGAAKFDFGGGTATATGVSGFGGVYNVDGATFTMSPLTSLTSAWVDTGAALETDTVTAEITIQVNAGGTLIPRFAQSTTDVTASTLNKYGTITAQDVTP